MLAIKVENLSKIYQLGQIGTGTISQDFNRWIAKVRGKEDPFLKIGEANDRTKSGSNIVYSLRDINFEINQGDAVGIIGRNGAGKSTLLKILSRVTKQTKGDVFVKGRIASLLEVGTGFHPELSGRENIFLNGSILGMKKAEIQRKLDEIIDFSGVERYIDTPVKRYSSGMYVRLAFAVAAHLESEILVIDEVLAVGDAEFQKKCLGKMGDISKGEGRTVLFVSHNINAITRFCNSGLYLKDGNILENGGINKVVSSYLSENNEAGTVYYPNNNTVKEIKVAYKNENICLKLNYSANHIIVNPNLGFVITNEFGEVLFGSNVYKSGMTNKLVAKKDGSISVEVVYPKLTIGKYYVSIWFEDGNSGLNHYFHHENCLSFEIYDTSFLKDTHDTKIEGWILPKCNWEYL